MSKFMLLLHEAPSTGAMPPMDVLEAIIAKYHAWAGGLAASGKLVGGEKLKEEGGKHLAASGGKVAVTDGPYAEARQVVGGYYTIEAKDYAEAVELAKACPHLEIGGTIEVREVDPM